MQAPGEYLKRIGKALRDPIKSFGLLTDFAVHRLRDQWLTDHLQGLHPALAEPTERFEEYAKELHHQVEKVLLRHGAEIVEREFLQKRIADMAIDLYAMVATLSRVNSIITDRGESAAQKEINLCKAFCEGAWRRIRRNARQIDSHNDERTRRIAQRTYEDGGYRYGVV